MRKWLTTLGLLSLAGCGGGGSGGPAPTPPPPTATQIAITGPGLIHIGKTETYNATATMSDGTQRSATGNWGGDAASVATVAATGAVTGVGSGDVTIWVDFMSGRGTKRLRGLPDYQGEWAGSYIVDSCSESGSFATKVKGCSQFRKNVVFPLALAFLQTEAQVTAVTALGTLISDETSASINPDGGVVLNAAYQDSPLRIDQNWLMNSTEAGKIGGSLTHQWKSTEMSGSMTVRARLFNVNRQSELAVPTLQPGEPLGARTPQDLIRAMSNPRR